MTKLTKAEKKKYKILEKKVNEYRKWCLNNDNHDPFKTTNAYWASGFGQFLRWLIN